MIVTLRTERIRTLDQMSAFVEGNEPADFELTDRGSAYAFVRRTLVRFEYHGLGKPDKNLRRTRAYRTGRLTFRKTRPTPIPIGVRRKAQPGGKPGFLRVNTVHLGDLRGEKGIYLINIV